MSDDRVPPAPPPAPATRVTRPSPTGDTVTVACKLPQGLILRVFDFEDFEEPQRDGSVRRGKRCRPIPDMQWTIRGTWVGSAGQAYNINNPAVAELLPGGYALTIGVPKEIWERWLEQNKTSLLVQNKIIFAHASHSSMQQEATALRPVASGLEPLDRNSPGARMPGGVDRRLKLGVLTQDEGTTR